MNRAGENEPLAEVPRRIIVAVVGGSVVSLRITLVVNPAGLGIFSIEFDLARRRLLGNSPIQGSGHQIWPSSAFERVSFHPRDHIDSSPSAIRH